MSQHLSKTQLKDRTLWFDGDSTYPASTISKALMTNHHPMFVDELNADIKQYNSFVSADKQIRVKTENRPFNFEWIIPDEYKTLDVHQYITDKLYEHNDQ
jgi:hypothetical protein